MKYRAILRDDEEIKEARAAHRPISKKFLLFVFLILILNFWAVIYISKSTNIYFWDDATYWDIARNIASGSISDGFWKNVYNSISELDYNYVAGLISAVFIRVFGETRLVYILSLVNMYLLPSVIMIYVLARRLGKAPGITTVITVLLCPSVAFLTFTGFVDIGGLFVSLLCFSLYYAKNENKNLFVRYFIIGILLVFLIIWRRWYAFFSVSFITAMAADSLLFRRKKLPVLCTVFTAAALLFFCFNGFLTGKLMQDYGNLYAGYKFSVSTDFKLVTRYFGVLFLLALLVSSIATMIKKKDFKPVFMWIQMGVCFIMFVLTQTHGQQHLLLYLPSIIMLVIILIKHITEIWMLASVCILALLQTVNVFIPRTQPNSIREIKHYAIISDFSMLPVTRDDVYDIIKLKNKLDQAVGEGETLGVLASSFKINEDVIKNAELSVGITPKRSNYIVSLPQVDSRDRDMTPFYNVNYVLVAFPAQTHLDVNSQTVVTEAVRSFEVYADFATAYDEMPEYETVIDGITLKLYKRNRMVDNESMREFEKRLYHQE
jgi:hypothetical protein